ncbi:hypothetical protein CJ030_MR4G001388 [Morella rubra]|uniref:Stigma-specific STIG1-like protein 1 n=1 Tax=Morella rubra TaxID=262757 RepID=A0A6A1VUE9_9ROSI|nr:hypothetical protein CJ030_MR4G001388 [Morella rubra]
MKLIQLFLTVIIFMDIFLWIAALPQGVENEHSSYDQVPSGNKELLSSSSVGMGRFISHKRSRIPRLMACNKIPRICRVKGSPGPHCCNNKCVNVSTDRLNCGMCGKKCQYNKICCDGKCVNPSVNGKHCGGCSKGCSNGSVCVFGLCNYA